MTELQSIPQLPHHLQRLLSSWTVHIGSFYLHVDQGTWDEYQMTVLCPQIGRWQSKFISFQKNRRSTIIKEIYHIQFCWLTQLRLDSNRIQSIQGLHRVQLPELQKIWLNNNLIISLGDVRKSNCPRLQYLGLFNNPVKDMSTLIEFEGNISQLYLESCFHGCVGEEVSWIVKMRSQSMSEIWIQSGKRIKQRRVPESIRRKYLKGRVWKLG